MFDLNGDGSIDSEELRSSLKKLYAEAKKLADNSEMAGKIAAYVLRVAEAFDKAADDAKTYESADAELAYMKDNRSVESRLGTLLTTRNIKIGDAMRDWDKDGNGEVDLTEFKEQLVKMGFKATPDEMTKLFKGLDDDDSGALDIAELKVALKALQSEAVAVVKEEKAKVSAVTALKKAARASQKQAHEVKDEMDAEVTAVLASMSAESESKGSTPAPKRRPSREKESAERPSREKESAERPSREERDSAESPVLEAVSSVA